MLSQVEEVEKVEDVEEVEVFKSSSWQVQRKNGWRVAQAARGPYEVPSGTS
jgi:hypothetical protein